MDLTYGRLSVHFLVLGNVVSIFNNNGIILKYLAKEVKECTHNPTLKG